MNKIDNMITKAYHKNLKGKVLCQNCGNYYHLPEYKMCWNCFSTQPSRITQYDDDKYRYDAILESKEK